MNVDERDIGFIFDHLRKEKTTKNVQENFVLSPINQALTRKIRKSSYLSELIVRIYYYDYRLFDFEVPNLKAIYLDEINNKK